MRKINIEIGTKSDFRFSTGNTLPLVATPFAMQSFVLQTNNGRDSTNSWFYQPDHPYAEGIRMTNQVSPWLGDYGQILMLATTTLKYNFGDIHSSLSHKEMQPNYMKVGFARYNTFMEVVPYKYGGKVRVTFECNKKYILFRNYKYNMDINVVGNTLELCNHHMGDMKYAENFRKFYKIYFDTKIVNYQKINDPEFDGIFIEFDSKHVSYDITTSYISFKQCDIAQSRIANISFNELKKNSGEEWEDIFNRFDINKTDKLFYSNVYRAFLFPHTEHEIDEPKNIVHYSFYTNEVEKGYMYTDISFWHAYRTVLPLIYKFDKTEYAQIVHSILNNYQESGWLPRCLAPFERGLIPTTLVDTIVAHAIVNNIYNKKEKVIAIEALLKNATESNSFTLHGRKLIDKYIELGYIPSDLSHESVTMTLDNAYCDYCISVALKHLKMDNSEYEKRAMNYLNLLDYNTLFFRPKKENGIFDETYSPYRWGTDFTKSDGLTNVFAAPHDINALLKKYTKEQLDIRFQTIMNKPMKYDVGSYGFESHEISEAYALNLGHVAISSQPGLYLPYVFLIANEKEKFYELMRKCLGHFKLKTDGYPGDENNGSMAAWYIWARIGEYPFDIMKENITFDRF